MDPQCPLPRKPSRAEEIHEFWNADDFYRLAKIRYRARDSFRLSTALRFMPKEWFDLLVVDISTALRAQDLAESEHAVAYLEGQLKRTNVAEIRELLAGLLRSHMESRMMATVEPNYAFSVIDPPTVPELKSEPKRALICVWDAPWGYAGRRGFPGATRPK